MEVDLLPTESLEQEIRHVHFWNSLQPALKWHLNISSFYHTSVVSLPDPGVFDDCQVLQHLRKKTLQAQRTLHPNIKVARGFEARCRLLRKLHKIPSPEALPRDIESHVTDLNTYTKEIKYLDISI
jgi:hypothetical protein